MIHSLSMIAPQTPHAVTYSASCVYYVLVEEMPFRYIYSTNIKQNKHIIVIQSVLLILSH